MPSVIGSSPMQKEDRIIKFLVYDDKNEKLLKTISITNEYLDQCETKEPIIRNAELVQKLLRDLNK